MRGLETSGGVPRPGLGPHPRHHGRGHHGDGDSLGRAERGSHVGKTTWEVAGTMNGAVVQTSEDEVKSVINAHG